MIKTVKCYYLSDLLHTFHLIVNVGSSRLAHKGVKKMILNAWVLVLTVVPQVIASIQQTKLTKRIRERKSLIWPKKGQCTSC